MKIDAYFDVRSKAAALVWYEAQGRSGRLYDKADSRQPNATSSTTGSIRLSLDGSLSTLSYVHTDTEESYSLLAASPAEVGAPAVRCALDLWRMLAEFDEDAQLLREFAVTKGPG